VAFPNYFNDIQAAQTGMLKAAGMAEADIRTQVAASAAMQTPFMNAISGVIGTVVTGVLVAAIAGAFLRKKVGRSAARGTSSWPRPRLPRRSRPAGRPGGPPLDRIANRGIVASIFSTRHTERQERVLKLPSFRLSARAPLEPRPHLRHLRGEVLPPSSAPRTGSDTTGSCRTAQSDVINEEGP